ncbi:MAG: metallophosphoesterase [Oscillospiraceae bacterium]|nr:metallophosphoesterase [Oscillospiraceae bacterium]
MNQAKVKRIIARSAGILAALLVLLLIAAGISAVVCNSHIKVTQYDVQLDGLENPARLVVVADIHGKVYGEDNAPLYDLTAAQEPDVIVLLGDLFPSQFAEADKAYVIDLTQRMAEIAPVWFAMGNHEKSYTAKYGTDWIDEIKAIGATVFDEEWADVNLCGNTIRIGGSMGHGYLFGRTNAQFHASPEYDVLFRLEHARVPAILLSHMPDTVALSDGPRRWHIDLVLSGHTHGGVVRVPGLGGLYAPMQGWWPPYDYGDMMLNDQMRMIITSGLSGHDRLPRIFNLPEIEVIDLKP